MNDAYRQYLKRQKRAHRRVRAAQVGVLVGFFGLWELGMANGIKRSVNCTRTSSK